VLDSINKAEFRSNIRLSMIIMAFILLFSTAFSIWYCKRKQKFCWKFNTNISPKQDEISEQESGVTD
jgi:hypothetical protein